MRNEPLKIPVIRSTHQEQKAVLPVLSQDRSFKSIGFKEAEKSMDYIQKSPSNTKLKTVSNNVRLDTLNFSKEIEASSFSKIPSLSLKTNKNTQRTFTKPKLGHFLSDTSRPSNNIVSPRSISLPKRPQISTGNLREEERSFWRHLALNQSGFIDSKNIAPFILDQSTEDSTAKYKSKLISLLKSMRAFPVMEVEESLRIYNEILVSTVDSYLESVSLDMRFYSVFFMVLNLIKRINSWFVLQKPRWESQKEELEKTKGKLKDSETSLEKIKSSFYLHGNQSKFSPKIEMNSSQMTPSVAKTQREEEKWQVERVKMEKEIKELRSHLERESSSVKLKMLESENEELKTMSQEILRRFEVKTKAKEGIIARLEVENDGLKCLCKLNNEKLEETQESLKRLQKNHAKLEKSFKETLEKEARFRETSQMEQQEIFHLRESLQEKEEGIKDVKKKLKALQKVIASLNTENSNLAQLRREETFEKDEEHLKELRDVFLRSPLNFFKRMSISNEGINPGIFNPDSPMIKGEREKRKGAGYASEEVNKMEGLVYMRPSFYSLIRESYKRFKEDMGDAQKELKSYATLFFGTMRGILDSKYLEDCLHESKKSFSKFVDFAFSFLGSNTIDLEARRIRSTAGSSLYKNIDEPRVLFYYSLYSERYDRLWEVRFFRECLEEKMSSDHLLFLLKCRDILFNGPQLRHYSPYEFINYVRWSNIEEHIYTIFKRFDAQLAALVIEKLRKKIREKNGRRLLDPYFVLKVLSELYSIDQNSKYGQLVQVFNHFPSVSKSTTKISVSFENFRKMIETNFPGTPEIDKAALYREAYCCGNGLVNSESFITAARETNFLNKYIRVDGRTPRCFIGSDGKIMESSFQTRLTWKLYQELQDPIYSVLEAFSSELGCEEFHKSVYSVSLMIRNKFQVDPAELTNQSYFEIALFSVLKNIKAMILTVLNDLTSLKSVINEQFIETELVSLMSSFHGLVKKAKNLTVVSAAESLHQKKKIIQLQKFLKQRYQPRLVRKPTSTIL